MNLDQLKEVGLIETSNLWLIMCHNVTALGCSTAQNAIQDDEAYVSEMCKGIWSHLTSQLLFQMRFIRNFGLWPRQAIGSLLGFPVGSWDVY